MATDSSQSKNITDDIDYEALPSSAPLSYQLLAGAFAGIMEHTVLFPIDAIKTRIQSASGQSVSRSLLNQISRISSLEGSLALWKGVQSVILGAGPAHAVYFATYEFSKDYLIPEEEKETYQPVKTAISGAMATIAADALMNPFDTLKQRLQLNTQASVWDLTKRIYRTEGISAFYVSYPTTLVMNVPFAAFNFMIYDTASKFFNPTHTYNPFIHCLCGGLSGATCAAVTTPLDCIKTVLQVKGSKKLEVQAMKDATNFRTAALALYRTFGWRGFWRGLKPRIIANMPATAISWTAYEMAKHFLFGTSATQ